VRPQLGPAQLAVADSLRRIDAFDGDIRAFVTVDAGGARLAATELDRRVEAGTEAGPLYGVTVGVKDIIDAAGLPTTCGSPILVDHVPTEDANVVARLRGAAAIVVGKTVTTEFATYDPPPTRNPWHLDHTPGGSSSGSAAAVAAGMTEGALGTQTAGSLVRPAAYCGVVGYMPSPGWVSRTGVYPCSWSLDRVGVFARSVEAADRIAHAIIGFDPRDPMSRSIPNVVEPFRPAIRFGLLPWMLDRASPGARRVVRSVAAQLKTMPGTIEVLATPPSFEVGFAAHATIMRAEIASVHSAQYRRDRRRYAPRIASLIEAGKRIRAVDYLAALRIRRRFRSDLDALLDRVDVLLVPPAVGPAERGHASIGDPIMGIPATFGGLPAITMPAALSRKGLPIGVQLIAARDRDAALLAVARQVQVAIGFDGHRLLARWQPPEDRGDPRIAP
jgi:Asp-tRNA(Asn)/Glu-tRNA(Gln) amidotransferase A subunit family amidase